MQCESCYERHCDDCLEKSQYVMNDKKGSQNSSFAHKPEGMLYLFTRQNISQFPWMFSKKKLLLRPEGKSLIKKGNGVNFISFVKISNGIWEHKKRHITLDENLGFFIDPKILNIREKSNEQ